jgi:endonuclease YncB( thermonuclease family)
MVRHLPILLALLAPSPQGPDAYSAKVVGVTDGDTITVLTRDRRQVKVRLHGIDAPESAQPYGTRAKQRTSELSFGQAVTVQPKDTDRYGRTVAIVVLPDGRSLSHELVGDGLAWWYESVRRITA